MLEHKYVAHKPLANGVIPYTTEEHNIWHMLYDRQMHIIRSRACTEFLDGIINLNLQQMQISQPVEVSDRLRSFTGWEVAPVPALINFKDFFTLLSQKKFPAASFMRRREDLDYLKEPDIFHEIFGHCPLLTNPKFAAFTEEVGHFGITLNSEDRVLLARLYWFTVEFGLIDTNDGLKAYGGGILSSKLESIYALEDPRPKRTHFDLIEILCRSYRYDSLQKIYYIITDFNELYNMIDGSKLLNAFKTAKKLGTLPELS